MTSVENPTHAINTEPAELRDCFDLDSPYDVRHVGKLVPQDVESPRRHCVVQLPNHSDLRASRTYRVKSEDICQ